VVWELEENMPMMMADPDRLEQVFINLLINARDAIVEKWESKAPEKGDKKITLKTMSIENYVNVEIRDTGTGIPDSILDKIFEPFFTSKVVGKGTGLGLSISYGIIKDCGGNIQAVPGISEGARFLITFPI